MILILIKGRERERWRYEDGASVRGETKEGEAVERLLAKSFSNSND